MAGVTGIGGVFFRSPDPAALQAWYVEHLGLDSATDGYVVMTWGGEVRGSTVWAPFPADTDYFGSDRQQWMVNYRVDDLDAVIARLRSGGVRVDDQVLEDDNGRFGWCWDLDGNRLELWEPAPDR
jgi:catechol 2,3-dioxygenase-like lactoylglutathione lyase family enzyme